MPDYSLSPEMQQLIGKRLRDLKHNNEEKLLNIETAIGISQGTISKIQNGHYPALTVGMLEKIATYYGVSLNYFTEPHTDQR